jgi:hypothetical protein
MDIWQVKVLCEAKDQRCYITFALESASADSAMTDAVRLADTYAPFGPKWESFTALSVFAFDLPQVLKITGKA